MMNLLMILKYRNKNKTRLDPEALKQRAKTLRHVDLEKLADEEQKKRKYER